MELGALVCTAKAPRCPACPARGVCRWYAAGLPPDQGPRRPAQGYAGTDRQVRGRLLDVLRASAGPVTTAQLDLAWPDVAQRARALDGLVADGLVEPLAAGYYALPGSAAGGIVVRR
jgi:A/G-specific adenine glycosylase